MLTAKSFPTFLLMMGSIDWLTTILGLTYFGAAEGNPFIASLANTNLPAFAVVKMGTVFFVAFIFYQIEKTLSKSQDKKKENSKRNFYLIRSLQVASAIVLMVATINNTLIIAAAIT